MVDRKPLWIDADPSWGQKDIDLPIVTSWQAGTVSWPAISFDRLVAEGYNINAAVGACMRALSVAFPEAPLLVKDKAGDPVRPDHPFQRLLTRPNKLMGHAELAQYIITYMAVGGNCYLHKIRNRGGQTIELWPYHDGHMTPIPGETEMIAGYEYDVGDGRKRRIPAEDIVHLKWNSIDLTRPWMARGPLAQLAHEIDTDSEITRFVYELLYNDAVPRTVITFPAGAPEVSPEKKAAMEATYRARHGRGARGGVVFQSGGATVNRMGLGLKDLDMTPLRNIPEARICAVFGVPAPVTMLYVGLQHMTYSNVEQARKMFIQDTLVPLWRSEAGELEQDLAAEFGDGLTVEHDLSKVAALQPDMAQLRADAVAIWEKGLATQNEARSLIFLPAVGDLKAADPGDVFVDGTRPGEEPPPPPPVAPTITEVAPPMLTDDEAVKALLRRHVKARRTERERIRDEMADRVGAYLERQAVEAVNGAG